MTANHQETPERVVLDHPNVSHRQAAFEVAGGTVVLHDLGNGDGTYVNGARLRGARALVAGDRIDIGPFQLTFDGAAFRSAHHVGNAELLVRGVSYDVRGRLAGGSPRRILHAASLHVRPSEFVCIIGANGAGKSTLMNILAGRARPSEGTVLLNELDLHANFEALKQDIGFVPQRDVLHEQLTVRQALEYAARLRLPPDTAAAQCVTAANEAARSVDLFKRIDQRISTLSGGQKKCAILAAEILNNPNLLLLDEVTSGLDESTDWEIMRLLRHMADGGMTIVIVTHTLANVAEFADKVACMGRGGQLTFVGPPSETLDFFAVHRLAEAFNRMDELGAEHWRAKFEQRESVATAISLPAIGAAHCSSSQRARKRAPVSGRRVTLVGIARQGAILLHRNVRLLLADRRTLVMAGVQSVLIGALIGYAFSTFGAGRQRIDAENALLLLLCLSAIWLGCNAASKEIVGEITIYRRERDFNLSTAAFVGAKFLVSGVFTVLQLAVVYGLVAALSEGIPGGLLPEFLLLVLGALAGTAMGLLISALVNTQDQATTIVPLALVPQLLLAGVLVPRLPELVEKLAEVAVSGYWLTEAMRAVFIATDGRAQVMSRAAGTLSGMTAGPVGFDAAIVAVQALGFLLIAYLVTLLRNSRMMRGA